MATGSPDHVLMMQHVVVVENVPVAELPATETAAGGHGRHSGTEETYQEVVIWTVTADKVGELKEILIISDDYAHTDIQVTVGSVTWATDWIAQGALPLIFEDLKLEAGDEVKVEAKSTDGTSIVVDAVITAKEIG